MRKEVTRTIRIHVCDTCGEELDSDAEMCDGCGKWGCKRHIKGFMTFGSDYKINPMIQKIESAIFRTRLCPDCLSSNDERLVNIRQTIEELKSLEKLLQVIYDKVKLLNNKLELFRRYRDKHFDTYL